MKYSYCSYSSRHSHGNANFIARSKRYRSNGTVMISVPKSNVISFHFAHVIRIWMTKFSLNFDYIRPFFLLCVIQKHILLVFISIYSYQSTVYIQCVHAGNNWIGKEKRTKRIKSEHNSNSNNNLFLRGKHTQSEWNYGYAEENVVS